MGEVYSLGRDCQYLLTRAARHRRAGRYDQAMVLLAKAKEQYADSEAVEFELACTYDEMGCEYEANRSYLRTACMGKTLSAKAFFFLALGSAQRADIIRAVSYYEAFCAAGAGGIDPQDAQLLQRQLLAALKPPGGCTRRQRSKALAQRAVERLNAGRIHAARRTISRSLSLCDTAQGHVMKACCHLLGEQGEEAAEQAKKALEKNPRYLQAKCVLADAYMMIGDQKSAKETLIRAAFGARSSTALMSVAVECAKLGMDELTLILTRRLLKREPFNTRAMAMRACAYANLGCMKSAQRLFARLCVLLPEDDIFNSYYRTLNEKHAFSQRLTLAQDVTEEEAIARCVKLASMLHEEPDEVRAHDEKIDEICRLSQWALHSALAGANISLIAIILLSVVNTKKTQKILFDALIDPAIDDGVKYSVMQALSMHCEKKPVYADLDGRFARVAGGAIVAQVHGKKVCQDVVQRAASELLPSYSDAAGVLLEMWAAYLGRYGAVRGKMADACACALEYTYHFRAGRHVSLKMIAKKHGASRRLSHVCVRRILRALEQEEKSGKTDIE